MSGRTKGKRQRKAAARWARSKDVAVDFTVSRGGTVYLLHPLTPAAIDWLEAHIPEDAQRWCDAVVIEHRFVRDIVAGIRADGLVTR